MPDDDTRGADAAAVATASYVSTAEILQREYRVTVTDACPPGTVVSAWYSPTELTFGLPGHRLVIETSSLSGAVHEGGLLVLEQGDGGVWVVPDELLGDHGLDVVRASLGDRLVER